MDHATHGSTYGSGRLVISKPLDPRYIAPDCIVQTLVGRPEFEAKNLRKGQVMAIVGLGAVEPFSQHPSLLMQSIRIEIPHAEKMKGLKHQFSLFGQHQTAMHLVANHRGPLEGKQRWSNNFYFGIYPGVPQALNLGTIFFDDHQLENQIGVNANLRVQGPSLLLNGAALHQHPKRGLRHDEQESSHVQLEPWPEPLFAGLEKEER